MEVTVDGMDAVVEPIGIYSRRVTGMTVLNQCCHYDTSAKQDAATYHSPYGSRLMDQTRRRVFFCYNAPSIFWRREWTYLLY